MAVVKSRLDRPFAPWRLDAWRGAALAAWAAVLLWMAGHARHGLPWALAGAVLLAAGAYFLRRFLTRRHGKVVEREAVRHLRHALRGAPVDLQAGVMTQHGDIDAVVSDPRTGLTWVIEIKAHRHVRVDGSRLSTTQGKPRDFARALQQARAHARRAGDRPVLWFPAAWVCTSGVVQGVLVVTGHAPYLRDVCRI